MIRSASVRVAFDAALQPSQIALRPVHLRNSRGEFDTSSSRIPGIEKPLRTAQQRSRWHRRVGITHAFL